MSHGATTKRHKNNAIDDEEDSINDGPKAPDGGWGWVVVFASFMIHIITDGVTYSFGVFYVQFVDYFHSGKGETAWILSILVGVTYCSGPIASIFVNKYGCRAVTIAGSILASASLMISVLAKNVLTLYFTIGLGTGFGFGLIYLPAIVSVTMYFEKYRSLATGIAVCGSGFGTFVFAPLIEWLNVQYGWKGAIFIVGALMLICIIFGILFRPLEYPEEDLNENELVTISEKKVDETRPINKVLGASNPTLNNLQIPPMITNGKERPQSMVGHYTMPRTNQQKNSPLLENGTKHSKPSNDINARLALSQPLLNTNFGTSATGLNARKSVGVMSRPDILYQGSLLNLPQYSKPDIHDFTKQLPSSQITNGNVADANKNNRIVYNKNETQNKISDDDEPDCCCTADTKDTFKEMLDFSLFSDPVFILFAVSNFLTSIGFNIPYVYIVPQATKMNISTTDSSYLLSIIGMANTVGRIVLGYISDKPWVNRLVIYNTCLTVCGIATFFSAFCYDFYTLALYAIVFGFTIGAYVGLTSVILVDLLGLDKLTNAFGILLLFQGLASLVGPPLAGWMYDILESYDPGFYLSGSAIGVSGVILFAIPALQQYLKRRSLRRNNVENM